MNTTTKSLDQLSLGIISDAHHYFDASGRLCALTILTRQFEQWAHLFHEVIVCAPLLEGSPPETHTAYPLDNIRLLPVENAGGNTWSAKIDLLRKTISWHRTIKGLLAQVDAIHIRCPNNISIVGLLTLAGARHPRQAVYTGSWLGYRGEPETYRLQRVVLKNNFNGPVAVYGEWPHQPRHIIPSFSPSYYQTDWETECDQVNGRLERLRNSPILPQPIRLLSVGALNRNKNQRVILNIVRKLVGDGVCVFLDLVGNGPEFEKLMNESKALGISDYVRMHGALPSDTVRQFYREADFVIQPSYTEGYSKVPIEAMFHGAVPLLSAVSTNPQIVGGGLRGVCFNPQDADELYAQVVRLVKQPLEVSRMIQEGRPFAARNTLESWREHIRAMLTANWLEHNPNQNL